MKKKQEPTALAKLIAEADVNTELDNICKNLLSHKLILAWILKYAVEEFTEHSVEAIAERYILDDTIQVSHDRQITGMNTECHPLGEGKFNFDLLFRVRMPSSNMLTTLLSPELSVEEKQNILESRFRLPMTTEIEEDMNNMCNISKSIKIEALKEGYYKGMSQGISQGISQGMSQGMSQGTLMTLFDLFKDGILSLEEAAQRANLSPDAFQSKVRDLQSVV